MNVFTTPRLFDYDLNDRRRSNRAKHVAKILTYQLLNIFTQSKFQQRGIHCHIKRWAAGQ